MKLKKDFISLEEKTRLHHCPIPIVGLTGGIATGKSTAAQYFQKRGIAIIDADKLVKEIYQKDETKVFITSFSPEAIQNDLIDFSLLRKIIFSNDEKRLQLESFIYKKMPESFLEKAQLLKPDFIIYDVPLLFEKKIHLKVDLNLFIYAPQKVQLERLCKRDDIDEDLARQMLEKQIDVEDKKKMSQFSIENTATLLELEQKLSLWMDKVISK